MALIKSDLIHDHMSEEIIKVTETLAMNDGVKNVTVRRILTKIGVTNRVFYNRFHNIEEVLEIVYKRTIKKIHENIVSDFDPKTDFFNYVIDVAVKVLIMTYDFKNQFCQYMFELDSYSEHNRIWWTDKIKDIIKIAKESGQLKNIDSEMLSYTVWCFFRGYNADAVNRRLSKEEAVKRFKFGLNCLFDGIKTNNKLRGQNI